MKLKIYRKLLPILALFICCKNTGKATGLTSAGTHQIIGLSYEKDCILSIGGIKVDDYLKQTVQAGFAYNEFIAFQLGYRYFSDNPYIFNRISAGAEFTEYNKDHFAHVSTGVFYAITLKNSKWGSIWKNKGRWYKPRNILFDLYAGFGKGINKRTVELTDLGTGVILMGNKISNSTLKFNKWYTQGGLHYSGHIIGLGLSGLFGIINFKKIKILGIPERDMLSLVNALSEDASYFTYGFQVKAWLCFDAFSVVYRFDEQFIKRLYFLNHDLVNYYGEVSLQININKLFQKKSDEP